MPEIPNRHLAWDAAESHVRAIEGGLRELAPHALAVRVAEQWERRDGWGVVPVSPRTRVLDGDWVVEALAAIRTADWLLPWVRSYQEARDTGAPLPAGFGEDLVEKLTAFLARVGDPTRNSGIDREERINAALLIHELSALRAIFEGHAFIAVGRFDLARRSLAPLTGEGVIERIFERLDQDEALTSRVLLRVALGAHMRLYVRLGASIGEGDLANGPLALIAVATRPLDALWLAIAVAAGHVEAPAGIEGASVCAYPPCNKVFLRVKQPTRGALTFCSDRHSKSYYAAARTRRRRAEEKALREGEQNATDNA